MPFVMTDHFHSWFTKIVTEKSVRLSQKSSVEWVFFCSALYKDVSYMIRGDIE